MLTRDEEDELRRLILLDWIRTSPGQFPVSVRRLAKKSRTRKVCRVIKGRGLGIEPKPLPWATFEQMVEDVKRSGSGRAGKSGGGVEWAS